MTDSDTSQPTPATGMPRLPQAACAGLDTEAFFAFDPAAIERARNVCRRCPEIRACLTWALDHREHGVWAGTTDDQRADLITRHGRTLPA